MNEQARVERRTRLLSAIGPQLLPGERVEQISFAEVRFKRRADKKNVATQAVVATVAVAAVAAVAGGTPILIPGSQRRDYYYVLLTDRRVLIVANYRSRGTGGFGAVRAAIPRESVAAALLRDGLSVKARLEIQGSDTAILLKYFKAARKAEGRSVISALDDEPRH
jgi:hypothetical protein